MKLINIPQLLLTIIVRPFIAPAHLQLAIDEKGPMNHGVLRELFHKMLLLPLAEDDVSTRS